MITKNKRYEGNFAGVFTAIVTPFKDQTIDFLALEKILIKQLDAGISGLVVCGSTGEGSSLEDEEYYRIIDHVLKFTNGRTKLIAGLGSNDTSKILKRIKHLNTLKLDGLLAVVPYYNKPEQEGLILHFEAIANTSKIPVILYNVPSRTVTDLKNKTAAELSKVKNIVGLKDATGDLARVSDLYHQIETLHPEVNDFALLSGEDATFVPFCVAGGCGIVSVVSNIVPKTMMEIYQLCQSNNYEQAMALQQKLYPLNRLLLSVTNPIGVKFVLSHMGLIANKLRLPLTSLDQELKLKIKSIVQE